MVRFITVSGTSTIEAKKIILVKIHFISTFNNIQYHQKLLVCTYFLNVQILVSINEYNHRNNDHMTLLTKVNSVAKWYGKPYSVGINIFWYV